jgi:dienelactone hydrolase
MLQTSKIEYVHDNVLLEGYCAMTESRQGKKPAVLVVHDWTGRNDFACQKAEQLAELGYVGFAVDMFGIGKQGKTKEEKSALIEPFVKDRKLLRDRILAAMDTVRKLDAVNVSRIAAIGFCFGGMAVLDLARSGADARGVVSIHGLLSAPTNLPSKKIHSKVLALHGYLDPMVPGQQVREFEEEMTNAGADWQVQVYGNTMHAFTNPTAHDPAFGTVYNNLADKRSWVSTKDFLAEIFS